MFPGYPWPPASQLARELAGGGPFPIEDRIWPRVRARAGWLGSSVPTTTCRHHRGLFLRDPPLWRRQVVVHTGWCVWVVGVCGHSGVPQNTTEHHGRPQNTTADHRIPQRPQNTTAGHRIPQQTTEYHSRPQKVTAGGHDHLPLPQEGVPLNPQNPPKKRPACLPRRFKEMGDVLPPPAPRNRGVPGGLAKQNQINKIRPGPGNTAPQEHTSQEHCFPGTLLLAPRRPVAREVSGGCS